MFPCIQHCSDLGVFIFPVPCARYTLCTPLLPVHILFFLQSSIQMHCLQIYSAWSSLPSMNFFPSFFHDTKYFCSWFTSSMLFLQVKWRNLYEKERGSIVWGSASYNVNTDHPGIFLKPGSDSVGMGWNWRFCIFNRLLGWCWCYSMGPTVSNKDD